MALSAALAPTDVLNRRPLSPEGSDFAHAKRLLRAATEGRRCNVGPACEPFSIEEAERIQLEAAAAETDAAIAVFHEARAAFERDDYVAATAASETAISHAGAALATSWVLLERYPPQQFSGNKALLGAPSILGGLFWIDLFMAAAVLGTAWFRLMVPPRRT